MTAGVILSEHPPQSHRWWVWCPDEQQWKFLAEADPENPNAKWWVKFFVFHQENPHVYVRLKEMVVDLYNRGFQRYSMVTLISVLRFESDMQTGGDEVPIVSDPPGEVRVVKMNQNYAAYYARMLVAECPRFVDFFEFRKTKDEGRGAPDA